MPMPTKSSHVLARKLRKIDYALKHLVLPACYYFPAIGDFHADLIGRDLRRKSGGTTYFTEVGMGHVRAIVKAIEDAGAFSNRVDNEEIWHAVWSVLKASLAQDQLPESGVELLQLVSDELHPLVQSRTFVLPLRGIEFKEIVDLPLGQLEVIRPDAGYFESQGLTPGFDNLSQLVELHRGVLWITGKKTGSPRVAEREFRTAADLTAGLLAVLSATMLKDGAARIRIGTGLHGGPDHGGETWFTWTDEPDSLKITRGGGYRPPMPIDVELRQQIIDASLTTKAFSIIHADVRNDLDESIARGFHWFADAHRDPVLVMQFVKYWSCIEVFFSMDIEDITKSISAGIASVLVFGGFAVVPFADYAKTKARVAQLYKKRSKAVHGASHQHVTYQDIVELSRWAAWLLVTMLSFSERGYPDRQSVKKDSMRLDANVGGSEKAPTHQG